MSFGACAPSADACLAELSPRAVPKKRSLKCEGNSSTTAPLRALALESNENDLPPRKAARVGQLHEGSPLSSTHAGSSSTVSLSESQSSEEDAGMAIRQNSDSHEHCNLTSAVEMAMHLYREAWIFFATERDVGNADEGKRDNRAAQISEAWAAEHYERMKSALMTLLPWLGPLESESNYSAVSFAGQTPPRKPSKAQEVTTDPESLHETDLKEHLEWLRQEPRGRAWEAFCALMAAVSTRKEKCWLEAYETITELEEELVSRQKCKSKKSAHRKQAIRTILENACSSGCGFFAHYLVRDADLRVSFARCQSGLTPASLVITARLPLWEALASLDGNGPLRGEAASKEWCSAAGRQFAFQDANLGVDETSIACRVAAANLVPDARLRDLLRSRKPAVVLEVVAALAPRELAKKEGLGEIVKAELARVMREAKRRGEAVVFCLGSDSPHKLAEKVYMRKPVSDYGLRCGYLRWRPSANSPWSRERAWSHRICLGLQLP